MQALTQDYVECIKPHKQKLFFDKMIGSYCKLHGLKLVGPDFFYFGNPRKKHKNKLARFEN